MSKSFFQRNNFDLLYQLSVWIDAFHAILLLRSRRRANRVLEFLLKKSLRIKGEKYFFCASGRSALAHIFKNLESDKKEVLVAAFTCEVVPAYLMKSGLKPVYYDCSPFRRINARDVMGKITEQTLAVVVQHSFGIQEDIAELVGECKKRGIIVIEDKALCFSSGFKGLPELQGDFAFYSFEASKTISCRMGGLLLFREESAKAVSLESPIQQSLHETILSDARTFLAISLYSNDLAVCLLIRRALIVLGILERSINTKDLDASNLEDASTITQYQKNLLILQLMRLKSAKNQARKNIQFWCRCLGARVNPIYLNDGCLPVRLPVGLCNAEQLRQQLTTAGMLDSHWFTSGVGCDGFDGMSVGFNKSNHTESCADAAGIINLPTIKKLPPRFQQSLFSALQAHVGDQRLGTKQDNYPLPTTTTKDR